MYFGKFLLDTGLKELDLKSKLSYLQKTNWPVETGQ
ncbi:hypothetical protein Xekk_04060 [Xenorhabdus sp. KK7.4]|nr:hypothetical protein Xekk_04060 [Xenorhabdus sp. KK7.4]